MSEASSSSPAKEQRRIRRRATKRGTVVICRKGTLGLGPNLAIRISNISEEGARLLLKSRLTKGEEIEISLTPPGVSRPLVFVAVVSWCVAAKGEDGFWTGSKFRPALSYSDIFNLV
jgi:PilZ domain